MSDPRTPLDAGMDAWLAHHPGKPGSWDAAGQVQAILDAAGPLIAAAALRESAADAAVARVRGLCETARTMGPLAAQAAGRFSGHVPVADLLAALNGDDA